MVLNSWTKCLSALTIGAVDLTETNESKNQLNSLSRAKYHVSGLQAKFETRTFWFYLIRTRSSTLWSGESTSTSGTSGDVGLVQPVVFRKQSSLGKGRRQTRGATVTSFVSEYESE